jgi:hypothetical protein
VDGWTERYEHIHAHESTINSNLDAQIVILQTENTEAAKDRLKQGLSSFLEGLTKLLVVEAEDKNVAVEKRKTTDPIKLLWQLKSPFIWLV